MDERNATTTGGAGDGPGQDRAGGEDGGEGRCPRSRRRGIKTSHVVLLGVAIVGGAALLVTGLRAADGAPGWLGDGGPGGVMTASWRGGWHGHGRGRFAEMVCSGARDEMLDDRLAVAESFVDFTDEQRPAWEELTTALRAASAQVGEACAELESQRLPATAPARLERVELMLGTGLDILDNVRPAFARFYAVLDPDQQAALDRLANRGPGR